MLLDLGVRTGVKLMNGKMMTTIQKLLSDTNMGITKQNMENFG